jgi:hypothetical protein
MHIAASMDYISSNLSLEGPEPKLGLILGEIVGESFGMFLGTLLRLLQPGIHSFRVFSTLNL